MSFGRAAQKINPGGLEEFSLASIRYKQACKKFTLQRLSWKRKDASNEELGAYTRALEVYKTECVLYNEARSKYIGSIRAAMVQLPNPTNDELFSITIEANERAITEQIRREAKLASVTPEEIEIVRRAHEERETARSPRFIPTTDDPTCGDFSPL